MLEKLLHCNLFRDRTVGIPTPLHTFHSSLHAHRLDVGLQDSLITDHPDHLIDDRTCGNRLSDGIGISLDGRNGHARMRECAGRGHSHQGNSQDHSWYDFLNNIH